MQWKYILFTCLAFIIGGNLLFGIIYTVSFASRPPTVCPVKNCPPPIPMLLWHPPPRHFNWYSPSSDIPFPPNENITCITRRIPSDLIDHPIRIVGPPGWYKNRNFIPLPGRKCEIPCYASSHRSKDNLKQADGIVYYRTRALPKVCPNQIRVYYTMENWFDDTYEYDVSWFAKTDTDIYASYAAPGYDIFKPVQNVSKKLVASAFMSNCNLVTSNRVEIIKALIKEGLDVEIFGRCFPGIDKLEPNSDIHDPQIRKMKTISDYHFHLVFENSIAGGYLTEKYFQALVAGTVPIVLGDPTIEHFEPGIGSVLNVYRFPDPRALVKRINELIANPMMYAKMLEYKSNGWKGLNPQLLISLLYMYPSPMCRLCYLIADKTVPQNSTDAILIREAYTYKFRELKGKPTSIHHLRKAIDHLFEDHLPAWHGSTSLEDGKTKVWNEDKIIYRIVKSGLKYDQLMYGESYTLDSQVKSLQYGEKLEILFYPKFE